MNKFELGDWVHAVDRYLTQGAWRVTGFCDGPYGLQVVGADYPTGWHHTNVRPATPAEIAAVPIKEGDWVDCKDHPCSVGLPWKASNPRHCDSFLIRHATPAEWRAAQAKEHGSGEGAPLMANTSAPMPTHRFQPGDWAVLKQHGNAVKRVLAIGNGFLEFDGVKESPGNCKLATAEEVESTPMRAGDWVFGSTSKEVYKTRMPSPSCHRHATPEEWRAAQAPPPPPTFAPLNMTTIQFFEALEEPMAPYATKVEDAEAAGSAGLDDSREGWDPPEAAELLERLKALEEAHDTDDAAFIALSGMVKDMREEHNKQIKALTDAMRIVGNDLRATSKAVDSKLDAHGRELLKLRAKQDATVAPAIAATGTLMKDVVNGEGPMVVVDGKPNEHGKIKVYRGIVRTGPAEQGYYLVYPQSLAPVGRSRWPLALWVLATALGGSGVGFGLGHLLLGVL